MPHADITMIPGRNAAQKAALAQKVKALLMEELAVEQAFISVSVQDVPMERWAEHMAHFSEENLFVKPGAK